MIHPAVSIVGTQFRKVTGHRHIPLLWSSLANAVSKQSITKGAAVA